MAKQTGSQSQEREDFDSFLDKEMDVMEQQRAARMKEKDYKPWFNIKVGTNTFEFVKMAPRPHSSYANRMVFRILDKGEEKDMAVSKSGRLYSDIIRFMKAAKKFPAPAEIIRTGTTRTDTRYTLQEVK